MRLAEMLDGAHGDVAGLRSHVGQLSPAERTVECLSLAAPQQKRLWEMVSAGPAVAGVLLPPGAASTVFAGRNSLRMFTRFEKRFARQGPAVVGCNRHTLSWLIGPGYFTVEPDDTGGLRFDYERVPVDSPPGWPAVAPNTGTFARPVYGQLLDRVGWVSPDVLIGSAFRSGKLLDSYFVLVRAEG
ncbi:MAG TPA: hypothetical protein VIP52_08085 [Candidatus Dormibacteraeota bacterium]